LHGWWSVANWKEAGRRLARAGHNGDMASEANGDKLLEMSD
jgi:hypothetical protein